MAIVLTFAVLISLINIKTLRANAAISTVEQRIITLCKALGISSPNLSSSATQKGIYFTTDKKAATYTNDMDPRANQYSVANSKWFCEKFVYGIKSPVLDTSGYTCNGFGKFATWYIYSGNPDKKASGTWSNTLSFQKTYFANCKMGDRIQLYKSGSQHTAIFLKALSDGIIVLDSNYVELHTNRVAIHEIYYTSWTSFDYYRTNDTFAPMLTTNYNINSEANSKTVVDESRFVVASNGIIYLKDDNVARRNRYTYGSNINLITASNLGLKRWGYYFEGWSTAKTGGTVWKSSDTTKPETIYPNLKTGTTTIPLYSRWQPYEHTFAYDANGGTGTMAPTKVKSGETITFAACEFTKDGYTFAGWYIKRNTSEWYVKGKGWISESEIASNGYEKNLYADSSSFLVNNSWLNNTQTSNTYTLYAVWESNGKTLTGINITHTPGQTNYYIGDEVNLEGLTVNATYSDGTDSLIDNYSISDVDMSVEGKKTVTVTRGGFSDGFDIFVNVPTISVNSNIEIEVGGGSDLCVTTQPSSQQVTFSSDDVDVATCENGIVTGLSNGMTTITAGFEYNGIFYSAESSVVVGTGKDKTYTMLNIQNKSVFAGNEFSTTVVLSDNPGIAYLKLEIDYDDSALELITTTNNQLLSGTYTTSKTIATKPYVLQWMGANNSDSDGDLVTLKFRAKENAVAGDYAISINVAEAYNDLFEDINIAVENGNVNITDIIVGDYNGDGEINGKDGILCSQALAGWDVIYVETAADVNGDGVFNGKDGILLSQYLAGWDVILG